MAPEVSRALQSPAHEELAIHISHSLGYELCARLQYQFQIYPDDNDLDLKQRRGLGVA